MSSSPPLPFLRRALERTKRVVTTRAFAVGLALCALAFAARLALILTSRFTGDEILHWTIAKRIASGDEFPLLGPAMTPGDAYVPGPLYYDVLAIPALVSKAPEVFNAFVALLGAVSVVLYWSALRPHFGEKGALLAAVMMACSPWSTLYADRIWNPNIVGIFVALAFWAACRLRKSPSLGAVVLLFAAMAAMPQIHMSSPMVCIALIPIWLPTIRKWRWFWPLVATAAAAMLYIPLLIHELHTDWSNTRAFLHDTATSTSTDYQRVPLWAFRLLTLDVSYHQLHSYWGPHTEDEMISFALHGNSDFHYGPIRWALLALSVLFALFSLGIAVYRTWNRVGRTKPHPFFWAALLGVAANTALLGVAHKEIFGHYVQSLLPLYFVAFAEVGRWAAENRLRERIVWGVAALVCAGGIDAAVWVSQTMDSRNGVLTMRKVIDAVEKDQPNATRVGLSFGYRGGARGGLDGFNQVAALDPKHRVRFDYGGQYLLMFNGDPQPKQGRAILSTGSVILYRMR